MCQLHLAQSTTHQTKVAKPKKHPSLSLSASCPKKNKVFFSLLSFVHHLKSNQVTGKLDLQKKTHLETADVKLAAGAED